MALLDQAIRSRAPSAPAGRSLTLGGAACLAVGGMQTLAVGDHVRLRGGPPDPPGRVVSRFDDDDGSWVLVEWADASRRAYLEQDLERVVPS